MHYFSGKGCSESLESMHYCIGILNMEFPLMTEILQKDQGMVNQLLFIQLRMEKLLQY